MSDSVRDLDLVLVGATGFVGRLTAAHLAHHAPDGLRLALAGRSTQRLEALRAGLPQRAREWPLIQIDTLDEPSVRELAARTRAVVTTVGPYLRYGLPLVSACAEASTHYADLTGETLFVRRSIDAAHEVARSSGARIVHSCGFDSVPSDLGVGLAAQLIEDDDAGPITSAVLHVQTMRGGVSGGTIDSLRQQLIETSKDPDARRLAASSWALVDAPQSERSGDQPTRPGLGLRRGADGTWQAPFVMGGYNRQIVQRSNALADWAYGHDFAYREVIDTGRGPIGAVGAAAVLAGTSALAGGMALAPTRALLDRMLPDPGQGPSEQARRRGRFRVAVDVETASGARYRTTVTADHDPGYNGTAVMLGESAIALADGSELGPAGVGTPMTVLGVTLADRLRRHGFVLRTERLAEPGRAQ